ncbi:hypothetical protein AB7008_15415 [Bradyrhizobium sp. 521_C7_N1_3]|nr:hypothetical protein [Bradyrhizobium japonicum]WLB52019.1 hypothetical protein QIH94_32325 [Bradyrhizobium japonicum]WLB66208.1 hypothetical protein QIH96_13995 [Bradyrhizobium japonicum]
MNYILSELRRHGVPADVAHDYLAVEMPRQRLREQRTLGCSTSAI